MTHFASFTAAAQLYFGIVTDAGAISMNAAFPQFSSLQDVVVAGALKDLAKAAVGREIDFKLEIFNMNYPSRTQKNYLRWREFPRSKCGIQRRG